MQIPADFTDTYGRVVHGSKVTLGERASFFDVVFFRIFFPFVGLLKYSANTPRLCLWAKRGVWHRVQPISN